RRRQMQLIRGSDLLHHWEPHHLQTPIARWYPESLPVFWFNAQGLRPGFEWVRMSTWARTSARRCCAAHQPCIVRASQGGDLCAGSFLPGSIPNVIGKRLWRREVLLEMYRVS